MSIAGGKGAALNRIFIVDVKQGGPAERDGRIMQGDEILEVNEISVRGLSHYQASAILKSTSADVELILGRSREATEYLARASSSSEPEIKPLNIQPSESPPSRITEPRTSPKPSPVTSQPAARASPPPIAPKPKAVTSPPAARPSPPPVAAKTVSPTLLAELSGGQNVEYIDVVKVCRINVYHVLLHISCIRVYTSTNLVSASSYAFWLSCASCYNIAISCIVCTSISALLTRHIKQLIW